MRLAESFFAQRDICVNKTILQKVSLLNESINSLNEPKYCRIKYFATQRNFCGKFRFVRCVKGALITNFTLWHILLLPRFHITLHIVGVSSGFFFGIF